MRRRRDCDHVDVFSVENAPEIRVTRFIIGVAAPAHIAFGQLRKPKPGALQTLCQLAPRARPAASHTDKRAAQRLAWCRLFRTPDHVAGDDAERRAGSKRAFQKAAPRYRLLHRGHALKNAAPWQGSVAQASNAF